MQSTTRFHAITARFTPQGLKTTFRRSSSASARSTSTRSSFVSCSSSLQSSPADTINSIMHRQPSVIGLEDERRSFGSELTVLEPRPLVYWGGMEERMGSF